MPSIKVSDDDGQHLLSINLSERSGWGRYLRSALGLRAFMPTKRDLAAPLTDRADTGRDVEFDVERPVDLGGIGLQVAAGARAGIGVLAPESAVFPASDLQAPVLAPTGTAMLACRWRAVLSAGATVAHGAASLGFEGGTGLGLTYVHPFDLTGAEPSFGDALRAALQSAVIPADVEDLSAMTPGAIASLSGEGHITLAGAAKLSAMANPLATPGLPLVGSLAVKASASVSVGAEWRLTGQFERRVTRLSASRVRLEYFALANRELTVSAQAVAGISANVRDAELVAMLMRAVSSNPEGDLVALVDAGLTNDQIEALQKALALSVNRSLTLSAEAQLAIRRKRGALFSYDVDLEALTTGTRAAVGQALQGSLTAIEAGGPGITPGPTGSLALRDRSSRWRLNLFGVLNAASLSTFVRSSTSLYDPASGSLQLADAVARSRIAVTTRPFEADPKKIRKVSFESLTVTAAYQASRLLPLDLALTAQHTYVEQRARTSRRDMADHFRAVTGLGLCTPADATAAMGDRPEFGPSTFLIECRLDRPACDALFLDADGRPHDEDHYDRLGREAMLALVPADDPERAHRRWPLERPGVWRQMRDAGSDIGSVLPAHIRTSPPRLAAVRDDFLTIVFWATAMRRAAVALAEMRVLLRGRTADGLRGDAAFEKARRTLEQTLAGVVATTESQFGDPWDVLVLDAASGSTAAIQAVVVARDLSASFESTGGPLMPERAASRLTPERAAAERRPVAWTPAQRAIFERHVVNLRQGVLSGEGSFGSTKAQVEAIFKEHVPAALAAARARGDRLRLVFYAHGGLTDEVGGLRMPLARHRFWTGNNVYPVYFVWETGFRETLSDLIDGLLGRRPGLEGIGDIADAALERGARLGGRPIWSAMKNSAAKAVAAGGAATMVSGLTADLWRTASSDLELHAIGHSAGSIFHAHFLPTLVSHRMPAGTPAVSVQSLHLLAPAATNALFKKHLMPIVGPGKPVSSLTMFTMRDDVERVDPSVPAYGKSLLYLVRAAFEDKAPTELVGLEVSLKKDLDLIRFFGLGGRDARAEIVFSKTPPGTPLRSRSSSVEHGAFDNDADTMNSVVRRILDVPDTTKIVEFEEEPVPEAERVALATEGLERPTARGRGTGAAARRAAAGARTGRRGARPAGKRWTMLVWMAGDNNLESFGTKDLIEMKRVGSNDDMDIVVQFDRQTDDRTRRYHVTAGGTIDDDVVEELGETNTGDPAVAVDFFTWGMKRYPAERVLTVLWNHGSGVDDTDIYNRAARGTRGGRGPQPSAREAVRTVAASRHRRALFSTTIDAALHDRAIAFDDTSRDFLDTVELKKVLGDARRAAGRPIDLVGFDACLMNMVEIAHQLRGSASYIVGSEEVEPGDGWPYDRVLAALAAKPAMTARELGTTIVDAFVASYATGRITQSLFALDKVGPLSTAVDKLAKALIAAIKAPAEFVALTRAVNGVQRFQIADFADLSDFCDEVRGRTKVTAVKQAADAVKKALAAPDGAVAHAKRKGTAVSRAAGAAIYLPAGEIAAPYLKLDFAKQTAWRKLLAALRAS